MDDREARWMIQYIYIQYIYTCTCACERLYSLSRGMRRVGAHPGGWEGGGGWEEGRMGRAGKARAIHMRGERRGEAQAR